MDRGIRLPIGETDFREIRNGGYYYVDKTLLIKDLIDLRGKVNLFTRPRRFGKTLNISMLRYFFEKSRRDGLQNVPRRNIMQNCVRIHADPAGAAAGRIR